TGHFTLCGEGLCIGYDGGDAVSSEYTPKFPFTNGTIEKVVFDVADDAYIDLEAHLAAAMSRDCRPPPATAGGTVGAVPTRRPRTAARRCAPRRRGPRTGTAAPPRDALPTRCAPRAGRPAARRRAGRRR